MASMEDLVATVSGVHVGERGADLKDLSVSSPAAQISLTSSRCQAKLAQNLHHTIPAYRPIPLQTSATHSNGPLPPPAPVSSWNSPPPNGFYTHPSNSAPWMPPTSSPRQVVPISAPAQKRETGFSVPPPAARNKEHNQSNTGNDIGSLGGFADDAFRPLWNGSKQGSQK